MDYHFDCGCSFPILGESPTPGGIPLLDFKIENVREDCPATWELLGRGDTKGVFQLESKLGKQWTRRLKPESLEHMGALGSLLRPGTLLALDEEGISITEHYCRRKNGEEPVEPIHPSLRSILADTYQSMIYQENHMRIAAELAGFDLKNVDRLRKSVAKKVQQEVSEVGKLFIEGVEKSGVISKEIGEKIWGQIKESGRYCFNKCVYEYQTINTLNGDVTVKELYEKYPFHSWESDCPCYSMTPDGHTYVNDIVDIQPAGEQTIFEIELENGSSIKTSLNHKFPTDEGEKTVLELTFLPSCKLFHFEGIKSRATLVGIKSINRLVKGNTYDITVEGPNHNFAAGDIFTCNSHAISYGITGYQTAYLKAHFPVAFFFSWLRFSHDKPEPHLEAAELVNEAKLFDIEVYPPDLRSLHPHSHPFGKGVAFGICDVKGVGESQLSKLKLAVVEAEEKLNRKIADFTWEDFLFHISPRLSSTVVKAMIRVGALSYLGKSRKDLLDEYSAWAELTEKEQDGIAAQSFGNLAAALEWAARPRKEGGVAANKNRVSQIRSQLQLLTNKPSRNFDSPHWIAWTEKELLGIPLTCSKVDGCDLSQVNCTCKEFLAGRTGFMLLGVEVLEVREVKTKKGKNPGAKMGFLTISDNTCALQDVVVFPDVWEEAKGYLTEGNTVIIQAERDSKKNSTSLFVKKVWQMS